ncbi:co-chaperone HscB [Aeromonas schubertii]|uniref:co-chaperone HscB n=1 Tax=Aeromonas schubertii TaxID=652 RepID=UPI001CC7C03A|nr:co-chaperone HscB [Aeromonas schubertii]MBZ6071106.1 co-chaperone HscB [Aeromonas schubertii]
MNHFELFGLVPGFPLDGAALAETYRRLQSQFHPDRFAAAPEGERLAAVSRAALINEAYAVLKSPLRRAEYLLSLQGHDIRGESRTLQDTAFLMQQLEWREALEDLRAAEEPEGAIDAFRREIKGEHKGLMGRLEHQLEEGAWESAADTVRKLKFVDKMLEELERLEDSLLEL